jgi:hypothetical protein
VIVQRRSNGGWKKAAKLKAGRNRVFTGVIGLRGKANLRALARGEASPIWEQR